MPAPCPLSLGTGIGVRSHPGPVWAPLAHEGSPRLDCPEMRKHQLIFPRCSLWAASGLLGLPGPREQRRSCCLWQLHLLPVCFLADKNLCPTPPVDASEATSEHDQPCLPLSGAAFVPEIPLSSHAPTPTPDWSGQAGDHLPPLPSCHSRTMRAGACPSSNGNKPRSGDKHREGRMVPGPQPQSGDSDSAMRVTCQTRHVILSSFAPTQGLEIKVLRPQASGSGVGVGESLWHIGVVFPDSPGRA